MDEPPDLTELWRRLAETIAWCRLHVSVDNPRDCLRTPGLRPANLRPVPASWGGFDYHWGTPEENRAIVSALADERARQLRNLCAYSDSVSADLAGGRLLVAAPEESDHCCLSEYESAGFIDALDVPAWDTWFGYLQEPTIPASYILCWIPAEFLTLVEQGIKVNPVECFFWAADYRRHHYDTPVLRKLDALGILR